MILPRRAVGLEESYADDHNSDAGEAIHLHHPGKEKETPPPQRKNEDGSTLPFDQDTWEKRNKDEQRRAWIWKWSSLAVLVVQNCSLLLLMRYSRVNGPAYISSTAVVCAEVMKVLVALIFVYKECEWQFAQFKELLSMYLWSWSVLAVGVPAMVYTIQNNLLYVAVTHLDAATTQVTYQLKILTTALFAVTMLHVRLTVMQWVSLVLLLIGVTLVQLPPELLSTGPDLYTIFSEGKRRDSIVGLLAVGAACLLSGFAGVYFEKILKKAQASIWVRNVQLGVFGVGLAFSYTLFQDGEAIQQHGFFYNYTPLTWLVIMNVAFGGLLVAIVVVYADNIHKGFATSVSVVLSTVFSIVYMDFVLSAQFTVGAMLVFVATFLYSQNYC